CRDLQVDRENCGSCGNVCPVGQACIAGSCRALCGPGLTECGNVCRDLSSDRSHCGGCGVVCANNQLCVNGSCTTCPAGHVVCDSSCVATTAMACHQPVALGAMSQGNVAYSDI